jgi:hypothetical protein
MCLREQRFSNTVTEENKWLNSLLWSIRQQHGSCFLLSCICSFSTSHQIIENRKILIQNKVINKGVPTHSNDTEFVT